MWKVCPTCKKFKNLTKHSKTGHHLPPFVWRCRVCHNKIHGIEEKPKSNRKYQPGTKKRQKK